MFASLPLAGFLSPLGESAMEFREFHFVGALLVLLVLEFVLTLAIRRRTRAFARRQLRRTSHRPVVECPSCGAENEQEYAFCRNCVSVLPGPSVVDYRADDSPGGSRRGLL